MEAQNRALCKQLGEEDEVIDDILRNALPSCPNCSIVEKYRYVQVLRRQRALCGAGMPGALGISRSGYL